MAYAANRTVADNGDLRNRKDPDQQGRAKRRTFEAGFKLRVLEEWDRADPAERSAILRREGIYSSTISDWNANAAKACSTTTAVAALKAEVAPPTPRSTASAARTPSSKTSSRKRSS